MNSPRLLSPHSSERGVVLVVAILILLVASILVGGFMFTTVGERAIASNVHVAKGSLYAADGGVRVTQQTLAAIAQTRLDSLASIWSGYGPIISPRCFPPASFRPVARIRAFPPAPPSPSRTVT